MVLGIINILGIVLFLYLTWRNLNDNYHEDALIGYSWLALLAMLVGGRLFYGLINWGVWNENWGDWFLIWQKPGFSYIGAMLSFLGLTTWYCKINDWKLWSFLEDIIPVFLLMMVFWTGEDLIKSNLKWQVAIKLAVIFLSYLLNFWVVAKYRSWVWYRSGKKGFSFFFTSSICCLLLAGTSIIVKDSWQIILTYLSLSLIFISGLFILGEVLLIKGGKNG